MQKETNTIHKKGVFSELKENDITKMRMRVYGGLKKGGVDYWDIIGHYYVYDWTIFVNEKNRIQGEG